MASVKEILSHVELRSKKDEALIKKAYTFAEKAHRGHTRYSGEPYFEHVFETARELAKMGMGPNTISAGLLHDTMEDVHISHEEIREKFGDEILFLVEGVTKLGTLKYRGAKRHTESLRKLFVATSQDIRVLIIKLMDRLHNMKTLEHIPTRKQKRIAQETLEIYVPLADRLGMGRVKRDLEDLAFPYVLPKEYEEIRELIKNRSENNEKRLQKITRSVQKALAGEGLRDFRTEYRIKGLYSLYKKLERKGGDVEKIHDIAAIRIIVPTVDLCYQILGIIHGNWKPLPGEMKDYIALPKPNGYRSIHTTIIMGETGIVEIQIRTDEMHRTAQYGVASHIAYKNLAGSKDKLKERRQNNLNVLWIRQILPTLFRSFPEQVRTEKERAKKPSSYESDVPRWIKEIADAQQHVSHSRDFLTSLKKDFFNYRVFVFTPKGDVVDLPIDSSPIDFAYAIHSDIGEHVSGVRVNGKMVSLDTRLKNGDIVDIDTRESSHPTQKWLASAKTSFARRHIRQYLQRQEETK